MRGQEKEKRIWKGFGWKKAAGDSVLVWMTLQSSHMPDRCHVWWAVAIDAGSSREYAVQLRRMLHVWECPWMCVIQNAPKQLSESLAVYRSQFIIISRQQFTFEWIYHSFLRQENYMILHAHLGKTIIYNCCLSQFFMHAGNFLVADLVRDFA